MLWIVKFIETDYRMVVTRGQGEMEMGCYCLMDSEFESEKASLLLRNLQCLLISLRGKATTASQFPWSWSDLDLLASHSLYSSCSGLENFQHSPDSGPLNLLFPLLRMLFPQIFMYPERCLEWNIGRASEIEHVRRVKTKTSLIGSKLDWLKRKLRRWRWGCKDQ